MPPTKLGPSPWRPGLDHGTPLHRSRAQGRASRSQKWCPWLRWLCRALNGESPWLLIFARCSISRPRLAEAAHLDRLLIS